MSLALSPVLDIKDKTAVDVTPSKIIVGLASGTVQIYARDDLVLERSFIAGKARVDAIQWIPNTDLVAIVCNSRCNVYNLATRRLENAVGTRSARLIRTHALTEGGRLAVASTYKLRIVEFSQDSHVVNEILLAAPEKHKIGALEVWNQDFYVIFGSKPKLFRVDIAAMGFKPLAMLHPLLSSARKFILVAAGDVMFIGCSTAAQLLQLGAYSDAPRLVGMLDHVGIVAAAPVEASSTKIPLFCVAFTGETLTILNPHTGSTLVKISSPSQPVISHGSLALGDAIYRVNCDVPIDFITKLGSSNLREAATLALSLHPEFATDDRIRKLQQQYAIHVFEDDTNDDHISTAMRLFTAIEEQEQNSEPINHRLVVESVILPFLNHLDEAQDQQSTTNGPVVSSTDSVFSARTTPKRKHILDPIVAYLVYARRHLRLCGLQDQSGGVDTALFRCYMRMHSPLVAPLLRSPNQCDPDVVKDLLLSAGKWRELVWFLRSKRSSKQHRQALDLLVEHDEPVQSIVSYLEQSHPEPSIVFEYAAPILQSHPELAHPLFFEEESYDSWQVYNYLHKIDVNTGNEYALSRVKNSGDLRAELHETVARLLASNEHDLLEFLDQSTSYRPSFLVDDVHIPPRAKALLFNKMQNYSAAIDIYLDPLGDLDAAQKVAEQHESATYLFDKLLCDHEHLSVFLNKVRVDTDLKLSYVLEKLPSTAPVESLGPFLVKFLAAADSKDHRSELVEAFSRVALTDYSLNLMDLRKERYVVRPTTACTACHKRLGQAVMGISEGEMVHYGCLRR